MKERIQALLEKELTKLEIRSYSLQEPLASADIKSLETLIKCWRSFSDPAKSGADKSADQDPANLSTDELLAHLNADQK